MQGTPNSILRNSDKRKSTNSTNDENANSNVPSSSVMLDVSSKIKQMRQQQQSRDVKESPIVVEADAVQVSSEESAGGVMATQNLLRRVKDMKRKVSSNVDDIPALEQRSVEEPRRLEWEKDRRQLLESLEQKNSDYMKLRLELEKLSAEFQRMRQQREAEIETLKKHQHDNFAQLESKYQALEKQKHQLEKEVFTFKQENSSIQINLTQMSAKCQKLERESDTLKSQLTTSSQDVSSYQKRIALLEQDSHHFRQQYAIMEEKVRSSETIRRRLHNQIQELRGNIRVFCRIRPPHSAPSSGIPHLKYDDDISAPSSSLFGNATASFHEPSEITFLQSQELSAPGKVLHKSYPFKFDRVFHPRSSQQDIFDEISQLVQSALDGYKVCIFAYGQTGSGKTFTMEGDLRHGNEEMLGVVPRAVFQIFRSAEDLKEKGWEYRLHASVLEIYNEHIRDLLKANDTATHDIKHNQSETSVTDLTEIAVKSTNHMMDLLLLANQHRAVGETLMNRHSSRSHSVFTLKLVGHNPTTKEQSQGLLHLVDLAGSERLNTSGALDNAQRLKETQNINKSLSALGDVISALANKESHIPYRNSKLTYLLQNSLGGNSKTLMFVNISPEVESAQETLCSLRFASKVNSCDIGVAKRNVKKE